MKEPITTDSIFKGLVNTMNSFDCKFDRLGEVDEFLERQILTTVK